MSIASAHTSSRLRLPSTSGPARAELLRLVSPLHDIGKIAVPDTVLNKTGPLDALERVEMERHTEIGHELLAGSGNELLDIAAVDRVDAPRALGRRRAIRSASPARQSRSRAGSPPSPTSSMR